MKSIKDYDILFSNMLELRVRYLGAEIEIPFTFKHSGKSNNESVIAFDLYSNMAFILARDVVLRYTDRDGHRLIFYIPREGELKPGPLIDFKRVLVRQSEQFDPFPSIPSDPSA